MIVKLPSLQFSLYQFNGYVAFIYIYTFRYLYLYFTLYFTKLFSFIWLNTQLTFRLLIRPGVLWLSKLVLFWMLLVSTILRISLRFQNFTFIGCYIHMYKITNYILWTCSTSTFFFLQIHYRRVSLLFVFRTAISLFITFFINKFSTVCCKSKWTTNA